MLIAAWMHIGTAHPVLAYLDPGTGSMVLQGILAAVAVIGMTAKLWMRRLLVLLRIRKPEPARVYAAEPAQAALAGDEHARPTDGR